MAGISLGLAVSAFAPNVESASALGIPLNIVGILFGGFYINVDALPIVANFIPFFSIFRWGLQAFCINEFRGLNFDCKASIPDQCILTGEAALDYLGFGGKTVQYPLFGLGMLLIGWATAGYLILLWKRLHFLSLGSTGIKYVRLSAKLANPSLCNSIQVSAAADCTGAGVSQYEMVPVIDE